MKNSNAVAAERRMDLASLFCMIGRHGPAVALVVLALVSVLAGFLIYRTVRGKRRKATAADSDDKSPGAERDTSAIQPSPEEPHGSTAESTEVSDEGLSDVKEDVDLIQSDLKVRHRRAAAAAAERKHPSYSPPKSAIQAPDDKHSASGETEEMAAARDSCKVAETREEGASQSLQGDTHTVAEMAAEEAVDCRRGATEDITEDVMEEVHDNDSCLVEPELVHDENHEEEEKVLKAEWEEDVTTDKDVSDKKTRQEEETPRMSESDDDDDDGLQDNKTILETSRAKSTSGERVVRIEDVPASCISQGKDEEFGEENPDGPANITFSDTERLPPEAEAEVERVDSQLTAQQAKMCSSPSERETVLPSTQQDHCDDVMDRVAPATRDSALDEDGVPAGEAIEEVVDDVPAGEAIEEVVDDVPAGEAIEEVVDDVPAGEAIEEVVDDVPAGEAIEEVVDDVPAGEVIEEVVDDDHLNALTAVKADTHSPRFDKQEVEIEQVKETAPTCEQEDAVLCVGADAEEEKMLTSDSISCSEVCEGSSAAPRPALPCWSVPVTVDTQSDASSPGEESGISSMAVSPDLQDVGNGFDMTVEDTVLPVMDYDLQSEGKMEARNSLFADDAAVSVISEDAAGMVFGPYSSRHSQPPHREPTDWTDSESYAANEDVFGHDVENSYHRMIDQLMTAIAARVTSFTDELEKQTDMKAVVEVVEIKEKAAGVSVEKRAETKAEQGEEEGYEKTEISIMEATMDNNEWITDSNYQALPWMNLSAPAFAKDHTKNTQLPTEECPDTTCIDATDIPLSTEVKPTSARSLVDENSESHKKVVAVQPMPQAVNVTFSVNYFTQSPYQTVAVTGSQQELGNWKEFIPLERAKEGHWATVVSLPAESHVEWKFVVVDKGEVCRWEECGNRLLDTGFGDDLLVHKWWGLL